MAITIAKIQIEEIDICSSALKIELEFNWINFVKIFAKEIVVVDG